MLIDVTTDKLNDPDDSELKSSNKDIEEKFINLIIDPEFSLTNFDFIQSMVSYDPNVNEFLFHINIFNNFWLCTGARFSIRVT